MDDDKAQDTRLFARFERRATGQAPAVLFISIYIYVSSRYSCILLDTLLIERALSVVWDRHGVACVGCLLIWAFC